MCGVFGIVSDKDYISEDIHKALWHGLQHRGQGSAGITTFEWGRDNLFTIKGPGEVPIAFYGKSLKDLPGKIGIGHTRYATAGSGEDENIQPIVKSGKFNFAICHNGNIVNCNSLRKITNTADHLSDTHIIADLINASRAPTFKGAIIETIERLQGSFCLVILFDNKLYAARDRFGFHPLQLGKRGEDVLVASESSAFLFLGGELIRDIEPGEMLIIDENGNIESCIWAEKNLKFCIFEYIYFLLPPSTVHGVYVAQARREMGRLLADAYPFAADIIAPVPNSGNESSEGYYERLIEKGYKIKFKRGALFRPHIGRTFIEGQEKREFYLKSKYLVCEEEVKGLKVTLGDDSIVRGTTMKAVVQRVMAAKAKEVNAVISSPPYIHPDIYGIDTYDRVGKQKERLIARILKSDVNKIAEYCGLNQLGYLSLENVKKAILDSADRKSCLTADTFDCSPFTGIYDDGTGDISVE